MLTVDHVVYGFPDRPDFLGPIEMHVRPGDCWAVVGPNGAGKTTLLRVLAGLLKPRRGHVRLGLADLHAMTPRSRARLVAYLPQHPPTDVQQPVRQIVLLGRYPHRSMSLFESAADVSIAEDAMRVTATLEFADRPLATLSGGEAQRVHLAAALAQQPQLLLLDEPTAALDLRHQLDIFAILRRRADRDGLAVVVVTHDVNLAARYCSHVLLLEAGRTAAAGTPGEVVTPEVLEPVYGVKLTALPAGRGEAAWIAPAELVAEEPA